MDYSLIKYIAGLLLFGTNGIIASMISLQSYEIVLFRTFLGSAFLVVLFLVTKKHFSFYKYKKSLIFLTISGISMGVSWMFLYEAYQLVGVSIASLCYYCGPVLVMAVSPYLFKEKFTAQKIVGFLVVLAGIVMVNFKASQGAHTSFGIFCAFMSALMYALMVVFNKKATAIQGIENSTIQLTVAFFAVLIFFLFSQKVPTAITATDIVPLVFLGLVNTGIGCYFYFSSIGKIKVQTVAVLGYLEPLSAIVFSVLFLHESMLPLQIIGAVLVLGGAIGAELHIKPRSSARLTSCCHAARFRLYVPKNFRERYKYKNHPAGWFFLFPF